SLQLDIRGASASLSGLAGEECILLQHAPARPQLNRYRMTTEVREPFRNIPYRTKLTQTDRIDHQQQPTCHRRRKLPHSTQSEVNLKNGRICHKNNNLCSSL
ncbi:hypothetical protein DPEC_G00025910, partial [Dallia pectoralis]